MGYQFNDEDKEVQEFADSIPFGVNHMRLLLAEAGVTEKGADYIELNLLSDDGLEDKARVWFTGGAAKYSFNTLRQILVHNQSTEENKDKARNAADSAASSDDMCELLNEHCINGELWMTKYYDPERTYTNSQGQTRRSINKNVYGYEPKLKPELMPQSVPQGGDEKAPSDPNNSGGEAGQGIPKEW